MSEIDFEISFKETSIPNLLDHHYSFLEALTTPAPDGSKVAYFNTITPFTATKVTPYFNYWMYRVLADSQVTTSPISLAAIGQGDTASHRFSHHYRELIEQLSVEGLLAEDVNEYNRLKSIVGEKNRTRRQLTKTARNDWYEEAKNRGLKPTDSNYESEMRKYIYTEWGGDIASANEDVTSAKRDKREYFVKHTSADYRKISKLLEQLDIEVALPLERALEEAFVEENGGKPDPDFYLEINSPANKVLYAGRLDKRPGIWPLTTIEDALDDAKAQSRSYSILKQRDSTHKHDSSWETSGGYNGLFYRGRASASVVESVKRTAKRLMEVSFGFKDIREIPVVRLWYDQPVFHRDDAKKILENQSDLATGLRFGVSSVILCRGMAAKLKFESSDELHHWREVSAEASGSKTILGFKIGGARADHYSRTEITEKDMQNKEINFVDSDKALRILGIRVHENPTGATDAEVALRALTPSELKLSAHDIPDSPFLDLVGRQLAGGD